MDGVGRGVELKPLFIMIKWTDSDGVELLRGGLSLRQFLFDVPDLEREFENRVFRYTNVYTSIIPVYRACRSGRNPVTFMATNLKNPRQSCFTVMIKWTR